MTFDAMDAWKERGRELQALYDVLGPAMPINGGDPVADLRELVAQRDRYRDALDALAHTAREFSAQASYEVSLAVEEEFIAALESAETLLPEVTPLRQEQTP